MEEIELYRKTLNFPKEPPDGDLKLALQKFYVTNDMDALAWLKQFNKVRDYDDIDVGRLATIFPTFKPYHFIKSSLEAIIDEMKNPALLILKQDK